MLKINHILYAGLGGVFDVCNILGKIDEERKVCTSFILIGPKKFKNKISKKNQKTYFVRTYKFSLFYFIPILKKLILEKPDLIFVHNFQVLPVFLYKIISYKNPKIIYVDHTPNNLKSFKDFFICKISKLIIDFFIVLNKDSYNYFIENIRLNSKKIKIIPNAINKNFIKNDDKKNKTKNILVVGMASRINNLKRHDLIIEAIQHDIIKNFNIKAYLDGGGENINLLKNKIFKKNIFKFFGVLELKKLKKWYNSLDLYIQATEGEGHSTSILQAMGMNLPVLGSNVSGVNNFLIPQKKIGIFFNNDVKSLAKKIKYFAEMKENKKNKIIRAQKDYILSNYSEIKFLNEYKKIIKKLIF